MMRLVLALVVSGVALAPRAADACVQLQETNKLLGWSADGTLALHARFEPDGNISHAELLPTRYEGSKYVIATWDGKLAAKKFKVSECGDYVSHGDIGKLTEQALLAMPEVKALKLIAPPADDGGASKLVASFIPKKRYAEHQVEIRDAAKVVATLPVPVWCVGSCLRDEDWKRWGASITRVATAGSRTLYVVRMARVCNGGNDKDLWIERVIAVPGKEKRPPRSRCKGSGQ